VRTAALRWVGILAGSAGLATGGAAFASRSSPPSGGPRPAASGGGFLLRPAEDARGCTPPRDLPDRPAPAAITRRLKLLGLPRNSTDGLPVLNTSDGRGTADTGWLPVTSVDYRGVRRRRGQTPSIYVIPSASVLKLAGERVGAPCPSSLPAPVTPGACLVTGPPGGPFDERCWTVAEIVRGRAFALAGAGRSLSLIGLVPTRETVVLARGAGPPLTIRSPDGVVDQPTRLTAGTRLLARVTP
jgi:hypothetical protein